MSRNVAILSGGKLEMAREFIHEYRGGKVYE